MTVKAIISAIMLLVSTYHIQLTSDQQAQMDDAIRTNNVDEARIVYEDIWVGINGENGPDGTK